MNESSDFDESEIVATKTCLFLKEQMRKLDLTTSNEEAEYVMQEVSRYAFPQINGSILYDTPLVRCVKINNEKESPKCITEIKRFSYPASKYVTKPGRMNIIGVPVFYSSNDINTSLLESSINEGDDFYASVWTMADDARMMTYPCVPYNLLCKLAESEDEKICELKKLVDSHPCVKLVLDVYANIFSIPHETKNPKSLNKFIYYLSGALGHSLFNQQKIVKGASYPTDAIMYPSVKTFGHSYNIAIRPQFVESHMKLLYVVKGKLQKGRINFSIDYVGFNENDTIVWKQMYKRIKDLRVVKIENEQRDYSPSLNETIVYKGKRYTIPMFESYVCNNPDSQIKDFKYKKDNDLDILNTTWTKAWEGDMKEKIYLTMDDGTKVHIIATINSFFSADSVVLEDVLKSHP